jgi:hypothetical protein
MTKYVGYVLQLLMYYLLHNSSTVKISLWIALITFTEKITVSEYVYLHQGDQTDSVKSVYLITSQLQFFILTRM